MTLSSSTQNSTDGQSLHRAAMAGRLLTTFARLLPHRRLGSEPDYHNPKTVRAGTRRTFQYTGQVAAPPEQAFPLLCPVLEYAWLDDWRCRLIATESGVAEEGAVFCTNLRFGETWIMTRCDPPTRAQYTVFSGLAIMVLDIRLEPAPENRTEIHWQRTFTATTRLGNRVVGSLDDATVQHEMATLHTRLNHYVKTGERLG